MAAAVLTVESLCASSAAPALSGAPVCVSCDAHRRHRWVDAAKGFGPYVYVAAILDRAGLHGKLRECGAVLPGKKH